MTEELIVEIKESLGRNIKDRVFVNTVPLQFTAYACVRIQLVYRSPHQTKDGYSTEMSYYKVDIYIANSFAGKSVYQRLEEFDSLITNHLNGLVKGGAEYRVESGSDFYEHETLVHKRTLNVFIFHEKGV